MDGTGGQRRRAWAQRRVGEVLRASVSVAPLSERRAHVAALVTDDLTGLAVAAGQHGIAGYVRRATDGLDSLNPGERERLRRTYEASLGMHMRILGACRAIRPALDAEVGDWVVTKGPVLTEPLHGRPDLRGYGDLDVLVPGNRLGRALGALEGLGGETLDRNWALLAREMRGEVHIRMPGDALVDLHWHLINDRQVRDAFAIPIPSLLERARTVRVGNMDVPTLDPVDTVLHLAVHAVLSGGHRLVWYKDVERAAAAGVDWDEVVARARNWNIGLVVGVALSKVRSLMGGDVPPEVVQALARSRTWRAVTAVTGRLAPVEQESGSSSANRLVARSTRATGVASLATLAGKAVLQARHRGDAQDRERRAFDAASSGSMAYDSGDDRSRRRFLAAVEQAHATTLP